jgi:hypothetical protein
MKNWITKLFKPASGEPIHTAERYGLRARVLKHPRGCGHTGYFIDLDMYVEHDRAWLPIACVSDTVMQDAIILLQQSQEFIGKAYGYPMLPTVPMDGTAYYFDRKLGEFRNVDDPHDRIVTERIA